MTGGKRTVAGWGLVSPEEVQQSESFFEQLVGEPNSALGSESFDALFDTRSEASPRLPTANRLPTGVRLGVWVDDPNVSLTRARVDGTVAKMSTLGIDEICVKVSGEPEHDDTLEMVPRIGEYLRNFRVAMDAAIARDPTTRPIDLSIYAWITPYQQRCIELVDQLPVIASNVNATAVEYDVESPWHTRRPVGQYDHNQLAKLYLHMQMASQIRGLMGDRAAKIGVNFLANGVVPRTSGELLGRADFYVPQLYSALSKDKLLRPYDRAKAAAAADPSNTALADKASRLLAQIKKRRIGRGMGPYKYPLHLMDVLTVRGKPVRFPGLPIRRTMQGPLKPLIVGLANFGRGNWDHPAANPGSSSTRVMGLDMAAVHELHATYNVTGVRYWSWKALRDARTSSPVFRFIRDLKRP